MENIALYYKTHTIHPLLTAERVNRASFHARLLFILLNFLNIHNNQTHATLTQSSHYHTTIRIKNLHMDQDRSQKTEDQILTLLSYLAGK